MVDRCNGLWELNNKTSARSTLRDWILRAPLHRPQLVPSLPHDPNSSRAAE